MSYLSVFRQTINLFLSNPTWDILAILFFFITVFLYGLIAGRNRIIVLLLASYPAALITRYAPFPEGFLKALNSFQILFLRSFIFFIIVLFIFRILKESGLTKRGLTKKRGQVFFVSLLNVALWASTLFTYVPTLKEPLIRLAPFTQLLFASDFSYFVWLVVPIIVLFFLRHA